MYVYIYIYNIYIYIYIEREREGDKEREREREREMYVCMPIRVARRCWAPSFARRASDPRHGMDLQRGSKTSLNLSQSYISGGT